MTANIFNVRVYGILLNEQKQVLVTDEIRYGHKIAKFPGGGLKFGEGTIDCLRRECMEELGLEIEVKEHFYTTDFFLPSAFNAKHQVISIYYLISTKDPGRISVKHRPFDFEKEQEEAQVFRWIDLHQLNEDDFTFPIEKKVAKLLSERFK
jgi:mutator protein MutT